MDAQPNDFYELIESEEQLSAEEIEETEDKSNGCEQTDCLNLKDFSSIITATENMKVDPILIRSLKFKNDCQNALQVYRDLYKSLARLKQTRMDQFLQS